MHVTFVTAGSQGDVQPMLALAVGLQDAGFQVRFCAHGHFEAFVRRSAVPFFALSGNDPQDVQRDEHSRKGKSRLATLLHVLARETEPHQPELDKLLEACQATDAVVFSPLAGNVYHAAESRGLPCCVAWLHPQYPTRFAPSPLGLPPLPLGAAYNLFTHVFMQAIFWLPCRPWVNRWRRQLGLEPISVLGPLHLMRRRRVPMLFGFSPSLIPRPKDWPEWMHVTGYWFLKSDTDWTPPEGLIDFLDTGPVPLSIGFGSVMDSAADALLQNILAALEATGQRAVLVSGWSRYNKALPANVFPVASAPYEWLFPRVSAAIHAAGAGTVAEVLRAGLPSISIPFAGEQKFYARRLADLGLAAAPIARQDAGVERLSAAITQVTSDREMQNRTKRFAEIILGENGTAEAVRLLKTYFRNTQTSPELQPEHLAPIAHERY